MCNPLACKLGISDKNADNNTPDNNDNGIALDNTADNTSTNMIQIISVLMVLPMIKSQTIILLTMMLIMSFIHNNLYIMRTISPLAIMLVITIPMLTIVKTTPYIYQCLPFPHPTNNNNDNNDDNNDSLYSSVPAFSRTYQHYRVSENSHLF